MTRYAIEFTPAGSNKTQRFSARFDSKTAAELHVIELLGYPHRVSSEFKVVPVSDSEVGHRGRWSSGLCNIQNVEKQGDGGVPWFPHDECAD